MKKINHKIYNKINNSKSLKVIIITCLIIISLAYFTFAQYETIMYNKSVNNVKEEIKELTTKINSLKDKETLLENNINATNSELETLKNSLTTLQNDLKTATDKLNSL